MTLPASGAISFNAINVELGVAGTTTASLGQASYRALAGVASGAISMSNFYGKANQFAFTIATNQTNANLRSLAVAAGWNQTSKVVATINAGVYVSASVTGTPGLTVNGSFPNGVTLTNNGFIIGRGGNGGTSLPAGGSTTNSTGFTGGLALSVGVGISITNNGTIGGGGGGGGPGGPGAYASGCCTILGGGGGGGGGRTGATNSSGGAGSPGNAGNGAAGGTGTASAAGGGGAGGSAFPSKGGNGGAGGGWGASGGAGGNGNYYYPPSGGAGGGAGGAVTGNGNITWVAFGTRLGAIS